MKTQPSIDSTEKERRRIQSALDQRSSAVERNRRGQFATPPKLALDMAALAKEHLSPAEPVRLLDPAVGTGVFFYAVLKAFGGRRLQTATGLEIDPEVAAEAKRLWSGFGLTVQVHDFCATDPERMQESKANLVVCNPPYVRHHHLSLDRKNCLRRKARRLGFEISGLAGLYCYFLLLADTWLCNEGIGVWIIPAEFQDVNYGRTVKEYLTQRVTLLQVHRFCPEDAQFADALVTSLVLLFRKSAPREDQMVKLTTGGPLLRPQQVSLVTNKSLDPLLKWGSICATAPHGPALAHSTLAIRDLFEVRRGLATGANDYFVLERAAAKRLGLPKRFLRPILPSPRFINEDVIEYSDDGFPAGVPCNVLLDCDLPPSQIQDRFPCVWKYLEKGERQGIPARYLPRHRKPWYRQEQRPPAPIICTYMGRQKGGRFIRFIRNHSDATATNVYHLLYPRLELAKALVYDPGILDRLFKGLREAAGSIAHAGRVYGGGLTKVEPKELAAVRLPKWVDNEVSLFVRGRCEEANLFSVGAYRGRKSGPAHTIV